MSRVCLQKTNDTFEAIDRCLQAPRQHDRAGVKLALTEGAKALLKALLDHHGPSVGAVGYGKGVIDALHVIGTANAQGRKLSLARNQISGFFKMLGNALGSSHSVPSKWREAALLQASWIRDQRAIATSPKVSRWEQQKAAARVRAFEDGLQAAERLIPPDAAARAKLLGEINARYGSLARLEAQALRNARVD